MITQRELEGAVENRCNIYVPDPIRLALKKVLLKYTEPIAIFYIVPLPWPGSNDYVGVFGDGDNGAYEWFRWNDEKGELETSDCAYGISEIALRIVLEKFVD